MLIIDFDLCRLDFDNFVVAQPGTTDQTCTSDQLIIAGGSPIPAICGVNSGQHCKFIFKNICLNGPTHFCLFTLFSNTMLDNIFRL